MATESDIKNLFRRAASSSNRTAEGIFDGKLVKIMVMGKADFKSIHKKAGNGYGKKVVKDGLETSFGGWKGLIDCEKLKKDIYASRRIKSTRPVPKFSL